MLILLMDSAYPFGESNQLTITNDDAIQVRQTIQLNQSNRQNVFSKATFIKNLKNRYLIKVQSILEEADCLHIMYEHVEHNFKYIHNCHDQHLKTNITQQLQGLGKYFSNIGVKAELTQNKIGMTAQGNLKYFMGLDFEWEDNPDENYLQCYYRATMSRLMDSEPSTHH